jgi:CRP-like cAMP-binding protein
VIHPQSRQLSGKLEGHTNTAMVGAGNTEPWPNHHLESAKTARGATTMVPNFDAPDSKEEAHIFLQLIAQRREENRRHYIEYARWAREVGLTLQEIADDYGVTADAISKMLKRSGGDS